MIELRSGEPSDVDRLAQLVFESAPILLPYLFGSEQNAVQYISQAMLNDDGQYCASRHCVATNDSRAVACITLWHSQMPQSFHKHTLASLTQLLQPQQIAHLVNINPMLIAVFEPPNIEELCIGHLAVSQTNRGNGIGRKLIAYAIRQAKNHAKQKLVLDVDAGNQEAISFYQACNFTELGEHKFAPTDQTFLRMEFTLN